MERWKQAKNEEKPFGVDFNINHHGMMEASSTGPRNLFDYVDILINIRIRAINVINLKMNATNFK